jgi:hypothetical protein
MGEPEVRLSDAERDAAVARLRESCAVGRLTLEEFSGRADAVYAARTRAELEPVVADLPAVPAPSRKQPRRFVLGLFGGPTLQGRWRVARRLFALCIFAGVDLDLRRAELSDPVVTIFLLTAFGGADVYVPQGVEVDLRGFAVFGGNDERGEEGEIHHGAPLVRVVALTVFGGVDVHHVPASGDATLGRPAQPARRELTG